MRKLIYLFASAALTMACSNSNNGYQITGTVENAAEGDTVYLATAQGRNLVNLDTTVIKNGRFTFTGKQDTAAFRYIIAGKAGQGLTTDFVLENGKITMTLGKDSCVTKGTGNNDIYNGVKAQINAVKEEMNLLAKSLSDTTMTENNRNELIKKYYEKRGQIGEIYIQTARQQIANAVGVNFLKYAQYNMDVNELDTLLTQVPALYSQDQDIIKIKERVVHTKATAVGQKYTDLTMKTPEGEDISLSNYVGKGKVVLLDFWASWCGPCRQEMPNIVEAYKKYKNKNFEIVGISLDRNADAWKGAIKTLGITWPQMSDLKYWDCDGARVYAVSGIPHTVLIDKDGTIIARGLHGEELQKKLAEIL